MTKQRLTPGWIEKREHMIDDIVKRREKAKARNELRAKARLAEQRRNYRNQLDSLHSRLSMMRPGVAADVIRAAAEKMVTHTKA
jgi:hypothetical protein